MFSCRRCGSQQRERGGLQADAGDGGQPRVVRAGRRGPHPREQLQGRQQMHRGPEHQGQRAGQGGRRRKGGSGCVGRRPGPRPRARRGKLEAD